MRLSDYQCFLRVSSLQLSYQFIFQLMMEKSKRGNGSTFMPYLNYLNHVSKMNNPRPVIKPYQTEVVEEFKEKLEHQRLKDHKKRVDHINRENLRLYHKISNTFENEKMPWLIQYGPRSLNFINKKQEGIRVMQENQMLKDKIEKARSSVGRDEIARHQDKLDIHKRILMEHSPSRARIDPLVKKHLRRQSCTNTLLLKTPSRNQFAFQHHLCSQVNRGNGTSNENEQDEHEQVLPKIRGSRFKDEAGSPNIMIEQNQTIFKSPGGSTSRNAEPFQDENTIGESMLNRKNTQNQLISSLSINRQPTNCTQISVNLDIDRLISRFKRQKSLHTSQNSKQTRNIITSLGNTEVVERKRFSIIQGPSLNLSASLRPLPKNSINKRQSLTIEDFIPVRVINEQTKPQFILSKGDFAIQNSPMQISFGQRNLPIK
ncbi:hypothetical protein FGO68_gene15586 [Halteria grandinella]|uniref:Uncharacterized protein n=1 Tax=Halteria grandinella TaxID=5974 RepID=A0A8J8P4S3_HALGN|nr:hypothetical protein FGO68_gene15586 [Halteria grandinella]